MSDNDLIRRGDALARFPDGRQPWSPSSIRKAIRAIPAAQVTVKPFGLEPVAWRYRFTHEGEESWGYSTVKTSETDLPLYPAPLTVTPHDPVAEVAVKPLKWFEVEKYRYGGKYTSEGYTIRYIEGFFMLDFAGNGKTVWRFPTLEAAKAAAQADYDARIRSALTVTTIDPAKVQALVDALEWYISEDETNEGDEPMPDRGNRSWNEINSYWIEGKRKAEAALAAMKEG